MEKINTRIDKKIIMITEFKIFEDLITPEESYSAFVNLKKYTYQKNVYIHFTDFNKLGVNPSKSHHDPYGIYFYPANFVFGEDTSVFQYGFSMKYYYICKINTRNFLNINKIDYDDIRDFFIRADLKDLFYSINFGDFGKSGKRYDKKLWDVLDMLNVDPDKRRGVDSYKDEYVKLPKITWNRFFSRLGYDGIIDNKGVINENEPKQLIVFNQKTIKILEHGENKTQKNIYTDLFNKLKNSLNCDEYKDEYKTKDGITFYLAKTKKDDVYVDFEINFDRNKVIFYYVKDGLVKIQKTEFDIFGTYRQRILDSMLYHYNSCLKTADKNCKIKDFTDEKFNTMLNKIFKSVQSENISYEKDTSNYYSRYGFMKFNYNKTDYKFSIEYCPLENNYDVCMKFEFKDFDEFIKKLNEWMDVQVGPDTFRKTNWRNYLKKFSLFKEEII